jgi:acetyl esterase/lipase
MKFDINIIDAELRFKAGFTRKLLSHAGVKMLKTIHKLERFAKVALPDGIDCSNTWIDREDGTKMRLRIYKPMTETRGGPAILWIHGGGYAIGTPETGAPKCKRMIGESGAVIVSPDYTLSSEKPYPAALNDCYLALEWLRDHALELGAKSDRIIVAGESAGGGLAIAMTLLARDKKDVSIAFQMPIYPMIDDRPTESSRENNAPLWNTRNNRAAWKLYLGDLYGTDDVPVYAAPARTTDYTGLPPAFTYVGDLDPFCSETTEYFQKLASAGAPAEYRVYKGCYHGFDVVYPDARVSREALEAYSAYFRQAVEKYY